MPDYGYVTKFNKYQDSVQDEIHALGAQYVEEIGIDFEEFMQDMCQDRGNILNFFLGSMPAEKAAELLFEKHVNPVIF